MNIEEALKLKKEGLPLRDIMQQLNIDVPYKTFQKTLWRAEDRTKGNIQYDDKKEVAETSIEDYYTALKQVNTILDGMDTKQTKATITINDNKPIAIAHWGDWHIGARGIDYAQFDKDRELIKSAEGLYYIGMGDYKDNQNALVHGNGTQEEITTPGMQDKLVEYFIEDTKDKCLALIRGCHDDWDKKNADKDFIQTLCEISNSVNMWHGGGINIKLGTELYKIRARHKYLGSSQLNTTNSQRRLLDTFGECDIIALAHLHYPDMQELDRMGQKVIYYRSGSYKVYDEFGQKLGGYKGKWGIPTTVLFPNTHKKVPFENIEDAVTYLKAVRM